MKIIHGENSLLSRQKFLDLKSQTAAKGFLVTVLPGPDLALRELIQILSATSLFGEKNYLFIEQFFTRKTSHDKKEIIAYLEKNPECLIVTWDDKDVTLQLKNIPAASIEKFDLPPYLFRFIDHLTLDSLRQALAVSAPEQILALLVRQMHNLLLVKNQAGTLPDWQRAKLSKITAQFSSEQLIAAYTALLKLDFGQKNSLLPYDLSAGLELWLSTLYHR